MLVGAVLAGLVLLPLAGCGGSSGDGAAKGGDKTTDSSGSSSSSGGSSDATDSSGAGELPDPCSLVSLDKASEILGEQAAKPTSNSNDVGTASRSCSWSTQASEDSPSLDNAGHILTLTLMAPPGAMSMDKYFDSVEATAGVTSADVCDRGYWMGGSLTGAKGDLLVSGSAGLADTSPDAKAAAQTLVETACASL
jgi:hypothetical protein